jgi:hypothetical protein
VIRREGRWEYHLESPESLEEGGRRKHANEVSARSEPPDSSARESGFAALGTSRRLRRRAVAPFSPTHAG